MPALNRGPGLDGAVTRHDGLWSAIVHGIPDGISAGYDVEHFAELRDSVREALIDLLEHDQFELQWAFGGPGHDYTRALGVAHTQAEAVTIAREHLERARFEAIAEMQGAGLSYRDIADALGISHQRVAQLVKAHRDDDPRAAIA